MAFLSPGRLSYGMVRSLCLLTVMAVCLGGCAGAYVGGGLSDLRVTATAPDVR